MLPFHQTGRGPRRLAGIVATVVFGAFGAASTAAAQPTPSPDADSTSTPSVSATPRPSAPPDGEPTRPVRFDGVPKSPDPVTLGAGENFTLTLNYTVLDSAGYRGVSAELSSLTNTKCDSEKQTSDGREGVGPQSFVFHCSVIKSDRPVAITYTFDGAKKGTVTYSGSPTTAGRAEPTTAPEITHVRYDAVTGNPPKISLRTGAKFTVTFRYVVLSKSGYNGTDAVLTKVTNAKCDSAYKHSDGQEPLGSNSIVFTCSVLESNSSVTIDYQFGGGRGTLRYEDTGNAATTQRPTARRPSPAIADTGAPVAAIFAAGGLALAGAGIVVIALSRQIGRAHV